MIVYASNLVYKRDAQNGNTGSIIFHISKGRAVLNRPAHISFLE